VSSPDIGPALSQRAVTVPLGYALRLARLHLISRRIPAAVAAIAACAAVLRVVLHWPWDAYGALQLPLIFEAGCAVVIATAVASPFGEPERATARWLPVLRLVGVIGLTAVAAGLLALAGIGGHMAGGSWAMLRNLAGLTGIGLLAAAFVSGSLAWTAPTGYLIIGVYGLYTQWHGPAITSPWIWPSRPGADLGAGLCAGLVFVIGVACVTIRGARDRLGD
jgi:hypothetical protein